LALSPIERGNVVHETLDRFNHLVLSGALPQPGLTGWSDAHLRELLAVYDEVADGFEATGRTGRPAHWHLDRESVRRELVEWFVRDGITAAERNAEIVSSEVWFGYEGDVVLPLVDGRSIAVRGAVDRIDRCADGTLIVMDHKTGSDYNFKNISGDDPTQGGTKFQLPAYAAAAASMFASTETDVVAEYDFFSKVQYQRRGYTVDGHVRERVAAELAHLVAGIEAGFFPATPGPPKYEFRIDCQFCEPDRLGTAERFAEWQTKCHDPRLADWFSPQEAP
jgi:hypothetical protein